MLIIWRDLYLNFNNNLCQKSVYIILPNKRYCVYFREVSSLPRLLFRNRLNKIKSKMKTNFTLLSVLLCAGLQAQNFSEQTIDLTASYSKDIYYDLSDASGEEKDATEWHLAFGLGNGNAAIHFQDSWGNKLYRTSYELTDWSSIDTVGLSSLAPLTNAPESWDIGGLNQEPVDPSSGFDMGWGTYDMVTHYVNGSAVYIAEIDGDFYKLFINQLKSGKYTFQYEKMESGSTLVQKEIVKSDYSDRTLIHYDMVQDVIIEREPEAGDWQFVIGKYIDMAPTAYPVVGVRTQKGIEVAKVENTDPNTVDYSSLSYSTEINTVGFNWKSFNMSTFSYDLTENLSYVLKESDGTIHHFYFTDFEGTSTGIVKLMYKTPNISISELDQSENLLVSKNPVNINESIPVNLEGCIQLNIIDQLGHVVRSINHPNQETILSFDQSGMYMINAIYNHETKAQKLIVQ